MKTVPVVAVSGLHRGENPQPGPAVARSLRRRHPNVRVVGFSYDPLESGLFSAAEDRIDVCYSIPFPAAGPEALLERIDQILEEEAIRFIIPCLDAEIPNLIALKERLWTRSIRCLLPTAESFAHREKVNFDGFWPRNGVATPRGALAATVEEAAARALEIGYPVFVKGRIYGGKLASAVEELTAAFYDLTALWGGPVVIQEALFGEEYDYVGLGDGEGGLIGSCAIRKMLLTKAGKAFAGVVVENPALEAAAARIVEALKWRGPFELEFIHAAHGYMLIEMNPRFPAWVDFASQVGCNLPAATLDILRGVAPAGMARPQPGKLFIRHCVDLVGDIADVARLSIVGKFVGVGAGLSLETAS